MKNNMPTVENFAQLLLSVSLTEQERARIVRSLNFLPERQIIRLYEELKALQVKEKKLFKGLFKKVKA